PRFTRHRSTPRLRAISSARGRLAVPESSLRPWLGTANPSMRGAGAWAVSIRAVLAESWRGGGRNARPFQCRWARVIAPGGFETPLSDPKSDVLPLDEGAASL